MDQDVSQTQAQGLLEAVQQSQAPEQAGDVPAARTGDHARRSFLKKSLAVLAAGAAILTPVGAGLATFLSPLRRKHGTGAGAAFVRVTSLDALPDDGLARRFSIIADRVNAWSVEKSVPIGSVLLKRTGKTVTAWNATCPHLGCAVEAKPDGGFKCPCHNSAFDKDGQLIAGSVSPRSLDTLEVDGQALARGEVRVKYQNFVAGTSHKIVDA